MPQLVNMHCVVCEQRISSALDARFCPGCMSPVHNACLKENAKRGEPTENTCKICGAIRDNPQAVAVRAQELNEVVQSMRGHTDWTLASLGIIAFVVGFVLFFGNRSGLLPTIPFAGFIVTGIGALLLGAAKFRR